MSPSRTGDRQRADEEEDWGLVVWAQEGEAVSLGGLGIVYKVSGRDTDGAYVIVEHPLQPGVLAAPPHTHEREDEVSIVLEGEVGVHVSPPRLRQVSRQSDSHGPYDYRVEQVPRPQPGPGEVLV